MELARYSRSTAFAVLLLILFLLLVGPSSPTTGQSGGRLVVALIPSEPRTLNPAITTSQGTQTVAAQIFNALVRFDPAGHPIPDLAQSWSISPDGRTYTFRLAPNVQWHDGVPFTSADVKFSFEKVLVPLHPVGRVNFDAISAIETPSDTTVVFRLKYPFAPLIRLLELRHAAIVPKHIYDGTDIRQNPKNLEPVGTGPFRLAEWKRGSFVRLVRNERYFKPGKPHLNEVVFVTVPDVGTLVSAMEAGQIDFVPTNLPFQLAGQLRAQFGAKGWFIGTHDYLFRAIGGIFFNLKHPALSRPDVRRAIAYSINKFVMIQIARSGVGTIAENPIPYFIRNSDTAVVYKRDVAKANALLDGAGLRRGPDGNRLTLSLVVSTAWPEFDGIANLARDQLLEIGIDMRIQRMDEAAYIEKMYTKRDFEMALSNPAFGPDPHVLSKMFLSSQIDKGPFTNAMSYTNPQVDSLFDAGLREQDPQKRYQIYKELVGLIMQDPPLIPIYTDYYVYAYRRKFDGLPPGHTYRESYENVRVKE